MKLQTCQVSLLADERFVCQHDLLGGGGVGGEESPVDKAAVTQVRIVAVLGADSTAFVVGLAVGPWLVECI